MATATTLTRPRPSGGSAGRPRDPAWRKAPVALARTPVVLAAVVGSALLVGAAAASGPLYLASGELAALRAEIAVLDATEAGLSVELPLVPEEAPLGAVTAALEAERARALPELGPSIRRLRTGPVLITLADGTEARVRLAASDAASGAGPTGATGMVVPPVLGAEVGQDVVLARGRQRVEAAIARVAPVPATGEEPELTGSFEEIAALAAELGAPSTVAWSFPLDDASGTDLDGLARRLRAAAATVTDSRSPTGAAVAEHATYRTRVRAFSDLPEAARRVALTRRAMAPPIRSLWAASLVIGFAVVGGAAILRVRRRRREHAILAARGVTPWSQAGRSALESAGGVMVGTAIGFGAVVWFIAAAGPGGLVTDALPRAALAAAGAAVAALVVIGLVTGGMLREVHVAAARLRRGLSRVPLEVVPLALALLTYSRMQAGAEGAGAVGVDPLVLAFPALALIGTVMLTARLLGANLGLLRRRGATARPPVLLAMRRIAASPGATLTLVALTAVAVGLATAAAAIAASADQTGRTKAEVSVGAVAAAPLADPGQLARAVDGGLAAGTTVVGRTQADGQPGALRLDVLAVDTDTFAAVAAWRPAFADTPLDVLLDRLHQPGQALPVVLVDPGADAQDAPTISTLRGRGFSLPVTVVGHARAWPGLRSETQMAVVAYARLDTALLEDDRAPAHHLLSGEAWASGTAEEAAARVASGGGDPARLRTVEAESDTAPLRAVRWTLAYLQAAAAVAGLLAGVTLTLAIAERQRTTEVSYVLASRMGLRRVAHRRAVALELAGLIGAAVLIGVGLGLGVAAVAAPWADPVPGRPPGPVFAVPWTALALVATMAVAVVVAGAAAVQRHVDRVRMGQVLRAAD